MQSNHKLIIHITNTFQRLLNILNSTSLKLSYSSEDFYVGAKKISSAAHPMVCFCSCRLNEINSKIITYGKYGISFSEDWAIKNKISPVLYIDGNSLAAKGLGNLLRARQNSNNNILPKHLRLPIMEIKCFTKNVIG
ncbi:abortive infection system antitoxin AbiGi family protein, partial [Desulfobacterota bacterium M19]